MLSFPSVTPKINLKYFGELFGCYRKGCYLCIVNHQPKKLKTLSIMKTAQKIEFLIKKMGLTDLNFKDAGDGRKFVSTQTRYRLYFTQDGVRKYLAFGTGWETESAKFFALQAKAAKMFGSVPCAKTETRSAFMRTITTNCTKCGGYGILPTFEYQTVPAYG